MESSESEVSGDEQKKRMERWGGGGCGLLVELKREWQSLLEMEAIEHLILEMALDCFLSLSLCVDSTMLA